jgi:ABC-type multidrug transport system ATPase subunit
MALAVLTEGLTRRYGSLTAVDDVGLEVEEGDLYGFLGPNGAGKTTTMRMILGLIRPSAGRILLFGKDPGRHFIEVMSRVGALVELPAAYPYLSAADNLEVLRLAGRGVPASRIPEVLETVGLAPRMHDRVRTYSQGMRQRLGIAMALLSRPSLVFLDEPTNGLDPQGVHHIRSVIRDLNRKEGVTVVLSSHLLHEIEVTCTKIGMIKEGRLVLQDRLDRVLERNLTGVRVSCGEPERARAVAAAVPGVESAELRDGDLWVRCGSDRFAPLNAALVGAGIGVSGLVPVRRSLEEIFLSQ